MREIDKIANEKFNGNINATIEYLLLNLKHGEFDQYVDSLSKDEARFAVNIIRRETVKAAGGIDNYNRGLKELKNLDSLGFTLEEVQKKKKNPYKLKILKSILNMLIMDGGVIAMSLLGVPGAVLGLASSVGTGLLSMVLASNIINYVKFKKTKKNVDSLDNVVKPMQEARGRSM